MKISKASILAVFVLMSAYLFAQSGTSIKQQHENQTASSSLELKLVEGKMHTIIRNHRFSIIYLCIDECSDYILHETLYSDQEEGVEGGQFEITVTASPKAEPSKNIWKIQATGDEGTPYEDFYKAIRHGCCGDENTITYYSLRSGKKVYSSSTDHEDGLLRIEVPNAASRYIAFSNIYQESGTPIGQLQYGDGESVRQIVTVKQPLDYRPPELAIRIAGKPDSQYAQLWSSNGDRSSKAVSGVTIVLSFDSSEVLIPVENDRLAVQKARAPKGFTVSD